MTNVVTTKAKRPKCSWFLFPSKVVRTYQVDIIYKNSKGDVGSYSSSPKTATIKIPWGPPQKCEFVTKKSGNEVISQFKFTNRRRETALLDEIILNNLESESELSTFLTRSETNAFDHMFRPKSVQQTGFDVI